MSFLRILGVSGWAAQLASTKMRDEVAINPLSLPSEDSPIGNLKRVLEAATRICAYDAREQEFVSLYDLRRLFLSHGDLLEPCYSLAMATDPDDRFADLNERISRFETATPDVSTPEPPQSSPRTLNTADRRFRRVNGWTIAIVLVLVLGLGVAQSWGKLSLLEMLWGSLPFFLAAAGVWAVNLFYWDLGKGAARRIWKRQPPPK